MWERRHRIIIEIIQINVLIEVMAEGAHLPKQIFHVDEAGLYWKRVADLSYISKEGKLLPGNKVGKDRLTLVTVLPGI